VRFFSQRNFDRRFDRGDVLAVYSIIIKYLLLVKNSGTFTMWKYPTVNPGFFHSLSNEGIEGGIESAGLSWGKVKS